MSDSFWNIIWKVEHITHTTATGSDLGLSCWFIGLRATNCWESLWNEWCEWCKQEMCVCLFCECARALKDSGTQCVPVCVCVCVFLIIVSALWCISVRSVRAESDVHIDRRLMMMDSPSLPHQNSHTLHMCMRSPSLQNGFSIAGTHTHTHTDHFNCNSLVPLHSGRLVTAEWFEMVKMQSCTERTHTHTQKCLQ